MLALGGALVALIATGAAWSEISTTRGIGGVALPQTTSTPGIRAAPVVVGLALGALAGGMLLAAARGTARRAAGGVMVLLGAATAVAVLAGIARAAQSGTLTPAPWLALAGTLAVGAAGGMAVRGPDRPPGRTRYAASDAERKVDEEWTLASDGE